MPTKAGTPRDRHPGDALAAIIGPEHVLVSREEREEYALDALSPMKAAGLLNGAPPLPDAVARPGSVEEVQRIVRWANETRTPLVPFGGGTGVLGGAVPVRRGVVVDLRRLDRVIRVSVDGQMVVVQAGMLLKALDAALAGHGLLLGHDPWSQSIATVGGAISTGGVGYLAAKYGTIAEQVLGLQVVLPTGELLEPKQVSSAAGPRLHPLFIGAEGTLGIITGATLRVFPRPERRTLHALAFESFQAGYHAILAMGRRGVKPSMIDYSQRPPAHESRLYLAFEGFPTEVEAHQGQGLAICREHGGRDLGTEEAQRFWSNRHASADAWAQRNAGGRRFARSQPWPSAHQWFDYLDPAVPPERVLEYRSRCEATLAEAGLQAREYDVWGRPDLFTVVVISPEGQPVDPARAAAVSQQLMTLAQDMGGSMEYVHGVGIKLLGLLGREPGAGLAALRAIKRVLDPNAIMNPGKLEP